jgi:hypothetical protein
MRQWSKFLFPLFLSTLSSCTFASYTDEELMQSLNQLAMRAISIFRFPRISLEYTIDEAGEGSFVNEITMNELEVVLSWMKVLWIEHQLSKERNYENLYADKDVKAFSSGNLISSIAKALTTFTDAARKKEEFYYRSDNGVPTIGDVNTDE